MIAPGTIAEVARITCRVAPFDWAFARVERARIDRHWDACRRAMPQLFDVRVLLSRDLAIEPAHGGELRGAAFESAYRDFLGWRDFAFPGESVHNLFAMPALRSADGAFMLGRMSAGTANAGRLYFPAGTPEPSDADASGLVDFDANILRELEEETGLAPAEVAPAATWTIVFAGPPVACVKIVQSDLTATALQARVDDFNRGQAHPELDGLVAVRSTDDFDTTAMPPFMLSYLRWAFAQRS